MQSILLNKLIHVVDELISVTNQWMQELSQYDLLNLELKWQKIFTSKCKIHKYLCPYNKMHIGGIICDLTKQCDCVTHEL